MDHSTYRIRDRLKLAKTHFMMEETIICRTNNRILIDAANAMSFDILVIIMTRTLTRQELPPNHATTVLGQEKEIVGRQQGSR